MKHSLTLLSAALVPLLLSACLQERAAPVNNYGEKFFGRDGMYDRRSGNQLPRYSDNYRAELPPEQEAKFVNDEVHNYGIDAAVPEVGSSDLPPVAPSAPPPPATNPVSEPVPSATQPQPPTSQWQVQEPVAAVTTPQQVSRGYAAAPVAPAIEQPVATPAPVQPIAPESSYLPKGLLDEPAPAQSDVQAEQERISRMAEQELTQPPVTEEVPVVTQAEAAPAVTNAITPQEEVVPPQPAIPTGSVSFVWPLRGTLLRDFKQTGNQGIAIAGRDGEPVRAAADGVVVHVGDRIKEYGTMVILQHLDGYVTTYGHFSDTVVQENDNVVQGQLIGFVGKSGNVDKPQLHFSIRAATKPLDPALLLGQQ